MQDAPNIARPEEPYDVIVVGSGMTGGWAAKELCEQGLKVLVVERGRHIEHGQYPTEWMQPWDFPLRGQDPTHFEDDYPIQHNNYAFSEATKHFFVKDTEHPYLTPPDKPFRWIRGYHLGGRSIMWGRVSWRWGDLDFEANAKDGHGVDWPIRYADLAPWYDKVEQFIGVSGHRDGVAHVPDGDFLPPWEMNCAEEAFHQRIADAYPNRPVIMCRVANLTRSHNGRGACQARNQCHRGCSYGAYFSALSATLPAAQQTGNLTIVTDAIVAQVLYDETNDRATGVQVIDVHSGERRDYRSRVVFMCASTLGTAQILLHSKTNRFPNGLANSSGTLGHYLMDHISKAGARGTMPGFEDRYYYGRRPTQIYIPRFRNLGPNSERVGFLRGYGYQGNAGREGWGRGAWQPGVGDDLKARLREPGPWTLYFQGYGECLPRYDNYVELDPERTDQWGLPLLRIHCSWSDNERAMREDAMTQAAEMLEAAGCTNVRTYNDDAPPGFSVHEMGTARMGRDPNTSVLNAHNQAWDVPNLFITDGACMTSNSCLNPSLTYMALTARAAHYAAEEMRRGNL